MRVSCGLGVIAILACFWVCFQRLVFPYELEWCEGGLVDVVRRLVAHQPIYAPPSVEYTCFQYAPFYYCLSAGVSGLFGVGFFSLRLVSFLATLGTLGCIALCAWRETRRYGPPLVAAGLFAGTLGLVDGWFPLARVDALFLFLFLASISVIRYAPASLSYAVLAGGLLFLSALTKQTALLMAFPLIVWLCLTNWRRGLVFGVTTFGLMGLSTLFLNHLTAGWYFYYTVTMLSNHARLDSMWLGFWKDEVIRPFPVALLLSLVVVWRRRAGAGRDFFWLSLLVGTLGGCWSSRLHEGSSSNSNMPAYAILALLFGVGLDYALNCLPDFKLRARPLLPLGLAGLCILQFGLLGYDPRSLIPSAKELRAQRRFYDLVRRVEGDVFIPCHGNLLELAGHESHANGVSTWDVRRQKNPKDWDRLQAELQATFAAGRFSVIILDDYLSEVYAPLIGPNYVKLPVPVFQGMRAMLPQDVYCRQDLPRNIDLLTHSLPIP